MNSKLGQVTRMAAFAAAVGLGATQMNAQQGTFNLPFAAHWGNVVLQPGEHEVKVPLVMEQKRVFLSGAEGTEMSVPLVTEQIPESNHSYLHVVNINGTNYIDEYNCGETG